MALLVRMNSRGKQERTLSASVVARAFIRKRGKEEKMERESEREREGQRPGTKHEGTATAESKSETLAVLSVKNGYHGYRSR